MKEIDYKKAFMDYFEGKEVLNTADIFSFYESMGKYPKATIYSRINTFLKQGVMHKVGRGMYKFGESREYQTPVSTKMVKIHRVISQQLPYLSLCVWELSQINLLAQHLVNYSITFVDVERDSVDSVTWILKESFKKVISVKKLYEDISEFTDYIIVRPLVTSSPVRKEKSVTVPAIEKILVDIACDKEFLPFQGNEIMHIYKTAFESYTINESKLLRYASRKQKRTDIENLIHSMKRQ